MIESNLISDERVKLLSKVSLFSGLSAHQEALQELARMMTTKNLSDGDFLIREGETGDELFILVKGVVGIYKNTPDADIYKITSFKQEQTPGLGEAGLIEAEPRSATVKCEGDCEFLVLNRASFSSFCQKRPESAVPILKNIAISLMKRLKASSTDLMLLHKALMNEVRS